MPLYNCKSTTAHEILRITKFTEDLEVESTYLVGPKSCECPQYAKRAACRHQTIRVMFMSAGHIDDGWLLDFDTRKWSRLPAVQDVDTATAKIVAEVVEENVKAIARIRERVEQDKATRPKAPTKFETFSQGRKL